MELIRQRGADPRKQGALVLLCEGTGSSARPSAPMPAMNRPGPETQALIATFVSADKKRVEERIVGQEYLEDLELMQSGVLFYRKYLPGLPAPRNPRPKINRDTRTRSADRSP
jgi:hypothetical protein